MAEGADRPLATPTGGIAFVPPGASVPLSVLRPLWLALPLLPWLALLVPWFAPPFTRPWFWLGRFYFPSFYLEPAFALVQACGVRLDDRSMHWLYLLLVLPYCLLLSLGFEVAARTLGRHRGAWRQIRRRTAWGVVAAAASLAIGIFGLRYAQWLDWPARHALPDHALFDLRKHAEKISELSVYEMPAGLLDHLYVARFRAAPGFLPELIGLLELEPVPESQIHEAFWTAPGAYWWDPPRGGRFHASRGFSLSSRGPDGDYYLLLQTPGDDEVWAWQRSNF